MLLHKFVEHIKIIVLFHLKQKNLMEK